MTMTAQQATGDAAVTESSSPSGDAIAIVGTALFSDHPAELASFYGMLLGIRFERRLHDDGRDHRIARINGVHFEIKARALPTGSPAPDAVGSVESSGMSNTEISFRVERVEDTFDYALTLGATSYQRVQHESWGDFAVVLDPDGNRLGLFAAPASSTNSSEVNR